MMSRIHKIKINAFYINPSQDAILRDVNTSLVKSVERLKGILASNDEAEKEALSFECGNGTGFFNQVCNIESRHGYHLIGFSRLSTKEGPARGNTKGEVQAFDLEEGEGFAQHTAVLFDPSRSAFLALSRKGTINQDGMLDYLRHWCPEDRELIVCTLKPVLRNDVDQKIKDGKVCTSFDVKFRPSALYEEDYKGSKSVLEFISMFGLEEFEGTVEISLKSQKKKPLKDRITQLFHMRDVCKKRGGNGIESCSVGIRQDEDDALDTLDLLNASVSCTVNVPVGPNELYIGIDSLFRALESAHEMTKMHFEKI